MNEFFFKWFDVPTSYFTEVLGRGNNVWIRRVLCAAVLICTTGAVVANEGERLICPGEADTSVLVRALNVDNPLPSRLQPYGELLKTLKRLAHSGDILVPEAAERMLQWKIPGVGRSTLDYDSDTAAMGVEKFAGLLPIYIENRDEEGMVQIIFAPTKFVQRRVLPLHFDEVCHYLGLVAWDSRLPGGGDGIRRALSVGGTYPVNIEIVAGPSGLNQVFYININK